MSDNLNRAAWGSEAKRMESAAGVGRQYVFVRRQAESQGTLPAYLNLSKPSGNFTYRQV
jgi:hypothetical protein